MWPERAVSMQMFKMFCDFAQQESLDFDKVLERTTPLNMPTKRSIELSPMMKDLVIVKLHPNLTIYCIYWCTLTMIAATKLVNASRRYYRMLPFVLMSYLCANPSTLSNYMLLTQFQTKVVEKTITNFARDVHAISYEKRILDIWFAEYLVCFRSFTLSLKHLKAISAPEPNSEIFNEILTLLMPHGLELSAEDSENILKFKLRDHSMNLTQIYSTAQVVNHLEASMRDSMACVEQLVTLGESRELRTLQDVTYPIIPEEISRVLDTVPPEELTQKCVPIPISTGTFEIAFRQLPGTAETCMTLADKSATDRQPIWNPSQKVILLQKLQSAYTTMFGSTNGDDEMWKLVGRIASIETEEQLSEYSKQYQFPTAVVLQKENDKDDEEFSDDDGDKDGLTIDWFKANYKKAGSAGAVKVSGLGIDTAEPVNAYTPAASIGNMSTTRRTARRPSAHKTEEEETMTGSQLRLPSARVRSGRRDVMMDSTMSVFGPDPDTNANSVMGIGRSDSTLTRPLMYFPEGVDGSSIRKPLKAGSNGLNVSLSQIEDDQDESTKDRTPAGEIRRLSLRPRNLFPDMDAEAAVAKLDERDFVKKWSVDHDRDPELTSEAVGLEVLRNEYGIHNLDVVRENQLLTIVDEGDPTDVVVGEAKLIAGDGPIANYVNQSLPVAIATAVAAFLSVDILEASINDPNPEDVQMQTMLHFLHNRMQCAENSDRAAWFGASVAVSDRVGGAKAVLLSLLGHGRFHQIHHTVYRNEGANLDDWYLGYNKQKLCAQLTAPDAARYCLVEFHASVENPNLKPTLEDMREVKRNICAYNQDSKHSLYPLCYIYTLKSRRNRPRRDNVSSSKFGYRVINSWHQIREQQHTKVHFMLVDLKYNPANDNGGRSLNLMPSRVCPVCGFCQSVTRMTKTSFETHMYVEEYNCLMGRYLSKPIDDARFNEFSSFYKKHIHHINCETRVDAIMREFQTTQAFQTMTALIRRMDDNANRMGKHERQVAFRNVLDLMEDMLRAPLVLGMNPFLHAFVEAGDFKYITEFNLSQWLQKISPPMIRILGLLQLDDEAFTEKCVPKYLASLLKTDSGSSAAPAPKKNQKMVSAARFGRAALFLAACRFSVKVLLMNLPRKSFIDEDSEDAQGLGDLNRSVSELLMEMASARPDMQTVDYCQDTKRSATDAWTAERSPGFYDAYRKGPGGGTSEAAAAVAASAAAVDDNKNPVIDAVLSQRSFKLSQRSQNTIFGSQSSQNEPLQLINAPSIADIRLKIFLDAMEGMPKTSPLDDNTKRLAQAAIDDPFTTMFGDHVLPPIAAPDRLGNQLQSPFDGLPDYERVRQTLPIFASYASSVIDS
jgi:hypothetical protein